MLITKIFRTETSHRVLNCTSTRCHGLHGHSYVIEITLEGNPINQSNMVLDFSAMKETIKPFVDSFDHSHLFCIYDDPDYISFMEKDCVRWIKAPFNWSCEMMALMIFKYCDYILEKSVFMNNENPKIHSVTVHETVTGRCTVFREDIIKFFKDDWIKQIIFSEATIKEWPLELQKVLYADQYAHVYSEIEEKMYIPWAHEKK